MRKGSKHSAETILKLKLSHLGFKPSEETRRRLSMVRLGFKHSAETIKKLSEGKLGEKNPMFGKHPSPETMKKLIELRTGEKNCRWKGGGEGYYHRQARIIWESYYHEKIQPGYLIHHKDGNYKNNAIENLKLMTTEAHISLHKTGAYVSPESRKRMSESAKRRCEVSP